MRILYLSCHEILEFDEILLLDELGHEVFSPGAYVEPANRGDDSLRPALPQVKSNPDDLAMWHRLSDGDDNDRKAHLTAEFLDRFDLTIVMHIPKWIISNADVFRGRRVVWRTIGQSIVGVEQQLAPARQAGLKVVRYSPRERNIPHFIGQDAMIRFYKDPAEFGEWHGSLANVITFNQAMPERLHACNYPLYRAVTDGLPRKLYGPKNEAVGDFNMGKVPYDQLKAAMRDHRVYFYVGTHPASYTLNFIEAWMTGIPIVAIGPQAGNAWYFPNHDLYEIPDLIRHGENGFVSDDPGELRDALKVLLRDEPLARQMSKAGRESAIKTFGKASIKEQWRQFLETV